MCFSMSCSEHVRFQCKVMILRKYVPISIKACVCFDQDHFVSIKVSISIIKGHFFFDKPMLSIELVENNYGILYNIDRIQNLNICIHWNVID